jgi:multiple sugar transport system substrate-binding protein
MARPVTRRIALAFTMALALVASACSGTVDGDPPEDRSLTFMAFGDPEELRAYRTLIEAFELAEPGISVDFVPASDRDDLLARLATSFSGGSPPDLFLMNYRFYGQFVARGVLEPLGPRIETSQEFESEDFYPQAMEAFQHDGEQICLPQNVSSLVVYYNVDLFRDAGIQPPAAGWTWDEMVAAADELTVDLDRDGTIDRYGLGVEPEIIRLAPFVWSNRASLFDDEVDPTSFATTTPLAMEAMARFFALRSFHEVVPTDEEVESQDDESRFLAGTTAMVMSSRRSTTTFRTITGFEWDVAPLPVLRDPVTILHSDAYCMTTASDDKDAAWRFVEFAVGPEGAPVIAETGRTVPSLISVATSEAFLDPDQPPAHAQVFLDTLPVMRRVPNISTWPEIEDAAAGILEQGFYEGAPVQEVGRQLIVVTAPMFARAE